MTTNDELMATHDGMEMADVPLEPIGLFRAPEAPAEPGAERAPKKARKPRLSEHEKLSAKGNMAAAILGLRPHHHLLSLLLRSSLSLRSLPRSRLRHVPGPRRCDLPRGDASPAMASGRGPAGVLRELPGQVLVLAGRDRAGPDPNCVMWLFILFVHGIHVHFSSCSIGPT